MRNDVPSKQRIKDGLKIKALEADVERLESKIAKSNRAAHRYKAAYERLLNSRGVKALFWLRKAVGKKNSIVHEAIPSPNICFTPDVDERNIPLLAEYKGLIDSIPNSNGSAVYKKSQMKIGIITDDFMFDYYKDCANFIYLNPDEYKSVIDTGGLSFVLYVSCWRGLRGADKYGNYDFTGSRGVRTAVEILEYARRQDIPSVFQSIEDPSSYDKFLPIAKAADYIFTSAEEMVDKYREDTKNNNVSVLEYGVNPMLHNPIGCLAKLKINRGYLDRSFFLAGSWYGKFEHRCHDTELLLDKILGFEKSKLYVADRSFYFIGNENRVFPKRYQPYVIPSFSHAELQKVHKLFDYSLNLNSVVSSKTMCAMRVYELQALGVPIISNDALAIRRHFPNISIVDSIHDISELRFGAHSIRDRAEGIRNVYSGCTVYDRMNTILKIIGLPSSFQTPLVYVVCDNDEVTKRQFEAQAYQNKIFVDIEKCSINKTFSSDSFIVRFRTGHFYGEHYIQDLINALKFYDADYASFAGLDSANLYLPVDDYDVTWDPLFKVESVAVGSEGVCAKPSSSCGISIPYTDVNN